MALNLQIVINRMMANHSGTDDSLTAAAEFDDSHERFFGMRKTYFFILSSKVLRCAHLPIYLHFGRENCKPFNCYPSNFGATQRTFSLAIFSLANFYTCDVTISQQCPFFLSGIHSSDLDRWGTEHRFSSWWYAKQ